MNPHYSTKLSEDLRVHGDEVEAGIHPFVKCLDGALGERDRRCTQIALPQQLQDVGMKGFRASDMVCSVPFQRAAQLARLFLCFGQLGLPVDELSMQVLLGAA
jgi:hypothetical protein